MSACGAKTRNGGTCKRAAAANGRCNLHGGKTPVGLALPQTKHGRYSKHLPTRLMSRYQEAEHDPELLSMRAEVHLIDARLADVLARVDTGESGYLWETLVAAKAAYYAAPAKLKSVALDTVLSLIDEGAADYAAWQDVRSLLEQRRRTVESERKRLVEMQQMVTTERLMLFVSSLAQVVRDSIFANVQDRDQARRALAAASTGIERLISVEPSGQVDSGGVEG